MEVELRLVRARVWLSSSLFLRQDGFLSLARVDEGEHVAHATLRSVERQPGGLDGAELPHKHFRSVLVAWDEQSSSRVSFRLPELSVLTETERNALPRLGFQLFALKNRSPKTTAARPRPQTVYIGASGWHLSAKDVEALVSSREVVFLTTLQAQLGTLEVKLRCVGPSRGPETAETEAGPSSAFRVNWSSSEALQKDLADKARVKAEADKKLIAQLKRTAERATRLLEARELVLAHLHRSRAANKIQRCYRALLARRRQQLELVQREHEARVAAKKAQVRDKVIARNRQRALDMRARLLAHMQTDCCAVTGNSKREVGPESPVSVVMTRLMSEQAEAERLRLKGRLAYLEQQRERTLQRMGPASGLAGERQQQGGVILDDGLVRAVQELHFPARSPASNQLLFR